MSGSALLKRLIRSLVNPAAMPDHSVSCCGCGAAAPDEQAAVHSEASSAAIANRRETSLADAIANRREAGLPDAIANRREAGLPDAATGRQRDRKRDDVVVTAPSSGKRSRIIRELNRFSVPVTIDDKSGGCSPGAATDNARS